MHRSSFIGNTKDSLLQSFAALLEDYRLDLEALNRSPRTISWYMEIIPRYFLFLESRSLLKPLHLLGTKELREYIIYLQKATRWADNPNVKKTTGRLSPFSIQGHVRALKAFWSWLLREGYIEQNPLAKLPLPKVPDYPIKVLSHDQITRLLRVTDKSTPNGERNHTIILLLYDTGIRVSELVNIRIDDINLQHNFLRVLGKGQKVRSVPFSNVTRKHIARYLSHSRSQICPLDSPYLFPTANGWHISVNCVQQLLRRLAHRADLNGIKCSPHILRHTFATESVANGANVFVLKEIMGHSSLITTMKYTHLQPHDLQLHHMKFSPVANLPKNCLREGAQ